MAVQRDRPYAQFNFLVDLGTGDADGPDAGFQECSGLGMELTVIEYRNGNDKENVPRKLTGLAKAQDVTLKRGIIGSTALFDWIRGVVNGEQSTRTVTIQLVNEDHSATVLTWRLLRARPIKYVAGPLNGVGAEVAMEELTLGHERLELE